MNANIQIRTTHFSDLPQWDDFVSNSTTATFFQTADWLLLWVKHFGGNIKIFTVYENDTLVGIAPFAVIEDHLELLGTSPVLDGELVTDFGDIITLQGKEKDVWEAILTEFRIQNSEIRKKLKLNFIREDSPSLPVLKDLGGKTEEIDVAPYLELPPSWNEYLSHLDRHDRHELKRKIKRIEREEAFKACVEGEPSDIDEFFRLMGVSGEQKRNFLSKQMRMFFQDVFDTFFPKNNLTLCFLKLDGKNIAAVMGFTFKGQFLLYNSGFDQTYRNLAPGFILKTYLIKYAIEKRMKRFEFLRGGERYKYDLGGKVRKLFRIQI